jgi:hypothetical protein
MVIRTIREFLFFSNFRSAAKMAFASHFWRTCQLWPSSGLQRGKTMWRFGRYLCGLGLVVVFGTWSVVSVRSIEDGYDKICGTPRFLRPSQSISNRGSMERDILRNVCEEGWFERWRPPALWVVDNELLIRRRRFWLGTTISRTAPTVQCSTAF